MAQDLEARTELPMPARPRRQRPIPILRLSLGWASRHSRRFGAFVLNQRNAAQAPQQLELPRQSGGHLVMVAPAAMLTERPGFSSRISEPNVQAVLGLDPESLSRPGFEERIHPADREVVSAGLDQLLVSGRSVMEYRFLHGDGTYHWIRDENVVTRASEEAQVEIVGYLADITDQRRISAERLLLAEAMDQTTDGVMMCDTSETVTYVNAALCEMTGKTPEAIIGIGMGTLAVGPLAPIHQSAMRSGFAGMRWSGSVTAHWRPERSYDLDVAVWPLMSGGRVTHLVVVLRDVTEERALTAALQRQLAERTAGTDAFARLRAGNSVEETSAAIACELAEVNGIDIALVMGFDGPQAVTPVAAEGTFLGREPKLLVSGCGAYLRRQLEVGSRSEDWVHHRATHDELGCTWGKTGLQAIRLEPLLSNGDMIGCLVAGTMAAAGADRLDELGALLAEYGAVSAALIGPGMVARRASGDLRAAIEDLLAHAAFSPVFQPVVELASGTVVGHEALTRFADGTPPDVLFANAALAGLGLDLEEATLTAALRAAVELPSGPWLSLNVSPELILEHQRLGRVLRAGAGRRVILEITEHAAVDDYAALRAAVAELGTDATIAVDDAGAGFASLRHIAELRPGHVKLDIGLVRGVADDPARQGLIAGMVHFAAETGCILIAEGIETEAELDTMRSLGVAFGQGYLLGRPASVGSDRLRVS